MKLKIGTFTVTRVEKGQKTSLDKGVLTINEKELCDLIRQDACITDMSLEFAYPGESTRIVHVLDAVEPRIKVEGPSCCFPGFMGLPKTAGQGLTHRLGGVAVISTTKELPVPSGAETGIAEFNEGIIDMSGPGQGLTTCSDTINICLCMTVSKAISMAEYDSAVRMAGLKTADYLARVTLGKTPDAVREYQNGIVDPDLPNVVYINQIMSQCFLARTFLYAMPMEPYYTPTLLSPLELMDGAVVSSNFRNFIRTCTYMQQNNYVAEELFGRHGKELNFVGMVLSRGHYDDDKLKLRLGQYAAKLAKLLDARAAVLSLEGTGNSNVDYMCTVAALENMGIAAVPIIHEFGGPYGDDEPLFAFPKEAISLVSGGGVERLAEVPAMQRVIGGETIYFTDGAFANKVVDPHSSMTLNANCFFCGYLAMQRNGYQSVEY